MPATESGLIKSMRTVLVRAGAYVNKNHGGPHSQGRPDLEGCYRGLFFAIEAKQPGRESTLTERQKAQLKAIKRAGGIAGVLTSRQGVRKLVAAMDKKANRLGLPGG
jgi:penicillin-binding protein-related factor A (putative recombinase)